MFNVELNKLETVLAAAVSKTMENMTFEEIETPKNHNGNPFTGNNKYWAVLPLIKPYSGELVLEITTDYGKILAEEVYGNTDVVISESSIKDVLAEIANTIAGRFIDGLTPQSQQFELGLPTTGRGQVPDMTNRIATILINVGEHPLVISIKGTDLKPFVKN